MAQGKPQLTRGLSDAEKMFRLWEALKPLLPEAIQLRGTTRDEIGGHPAMAWYQPREPQTATATPATGPEATINLDLANINRFGQWGWENFPGYTPEEIITHEAAHSIQHKKEQAALKKNPQATLEDMHGPSFLSAMGDLLKLVNVKPSTTRPKWEAGADEYERSQQKRPGAPRRDI